ncbi:MAG: hypothetical protein JNN27_12065 [Planctomycetes bacterium]|nr:hypothetical protein [Planctomycetota bacterium]
MSTPVSRTRTLALAAVVAALVVVLLLRLANTPSHEQSAKSSQPAERAAPPQPLVAETPLEPVVERSARIAAASELEVFGSVRIASPNGPVGEYLQGSLTYSFGLESQPEVAGETHTTQVVDSSWRIVAPDGVTLHWRSALIDGRRYSVEPAVVRCQSNLSRASGAPGAPQARDKLLWHRTTDGNEPVPLLLHPPRALKLHVVDAQTGEQLDGLELLRANSAISDVSVPPDAKAVQLGEGLTSPLTLTPVNGVEVLWVRRAGYAWSHVVVDHREDVDRCVALQAACQARVRLDGPLPPGDALVVIEYFDGEPSDPARARSPGRALARTVHTKQLPAWVTFELPPGRWKARLGSDGATLDDGGGASFETLPGAVTDVVLDGRRSETPREPSTLASAVSFEIELLSEDLAALGEFAHLVSDPPSADPRSRIGAAFVEARPNAANGPCVVVGFDAVAPGAYRLVLAKTQWSTQLFVNTDGAAPKVIRVPAVVPSSFAFHDSLTGKPVEINSVHWSATGLGAPPSLATRLPGVSAWRVDSHADEFDFILFVAGRTAPLEVTARVAARSEVTRVDLDPGASLTVALRDASAGVFARHAWWQAIEILDENGVLVKVAPSVEAAVPFARQAEFHVPRAGRYTVRLPALNSHHAAPPQVVELASGAVQRLEFQLTALGCR